LSDLAKNARDPAKPFGVRFGYWLATFSLLFAIQAGIDISLTNNPAFDKPALGRDWLLAMKYDDAWVSPWLWCLRQGSLVVGLAIMAVVLGWGLFHWSRNRKSA
jgi:hypothetical protein